AGFLNQFPTPPGVAYLRAAGACAVIVHADTPMGRAILKTSEAQRLRTRSISATEYLVEVPEAPAPPPDGPALPRDGWRVVQPASAAAALDGSLDTLAELAVADAEPLERLVVDLGRPQRIAGVDVELGSRFRHYLVTYRIEGSLDGVAWSTLAEADAAVPPFESYRADPHAVVQRIRFPASEARFLRLGPFRPPPEGLAMDVGFKRWGVAELTVRGEAAGAEPAG
ncbi:MAG TPA: discoidin domain-containing protein, partial [Candidatus Limnocylindria bacterium]|nr:discoidin domain-containing protein [Candidatus Limnocylindria bacterium]